MAQKIKIFILNLFIVKLIITILKRVSLPGFDKIPIYHVGQFFIKGLFKGDISQRAAALSFTFFLALFPALLAFFSLIPYIPINNFQPMLLSFLEELIPKSTWVVIESVITDIVSRQRGSLLSISFLFSIFLATNGVMAISQAFNSSFHAIETRTGFKQRMISLLLVGIITVLIVLSIASIAMGRFFINYLSDQNFLNSSFSIASLVFLKWLIVLALIFFAISFIFYLAPANQKYYRFISAGSSLTTFMALLMLIGFDFYVSNFTKYNAVYGSIGTLIVLMMWLYFNSIALLIGFELNVSIYKAGKNLNDIKNQLQKP